MASSTKRLFGVPRMLSMMTAPSTVYWLSNDCAPPIDAALFGPLLLTPTERLIEEMIVRAIGSFCVSSEV